jgi:MoxR-like ATPase
MTKTWDSTLTGLFASGAVPQAIHRILLWGPPRTGKSSIAAAVLGKNRVERVTLHRQQPVDDLIGGYCLQDGTTVWADGPAVRAMRQGKVLVLDEIDQFSPETRCMLHALMDDPSAVTLANGERVEAEYGYVVVATTNALPGSLPPAILDRFDLVLKADTLSDGLQKRLGKLAEPAGNTIGRDATRYQWTRQASINLFLSTAKLRGFGMTDEAIAAVLGLEGTDLTDFLTAIAVTA